MKIAPKDTASFLKSPDAQSGAVLLYGPDTGLIRERSRAIAALILGKGSDPINRVALSGEQVKADPAILRDELCALSLMAGRRVVIIESAGDKITGAIESALDGVRTTTYLIVESDELTPSSSLRQFFEKQPGCAALACYHDEGRSLEDTLRTGIAARGLRAQADAMHYLMEHLGNDRGITASELDKIAIYMGSEKEVTLDCVMQLVGNNASQGLEDICHSVACGDTRRTETLLARLLHEGTQPVAIVRSLLRHFQRLEIAQAHVKAGQSAEQALNQLRPPIFFKYVPQARRALSLWNARSLSIALGLLMKTERELKSGVLAAGLVAGHALQRTARMVAA